MFARANRLTRLQRYLEQVLPGELQGACDLVGLDAGDLRLLVRSPAHAAHLRFGQRRLLADFAEILPPGEAAARKLTIVVRPGVDTAGRRADTGAASPRSIPGAAGADLERLARDEPDPALRAALTRLATRGVTSTGPSSSEDEPHQ